MSTLLQPKDWKKFVKPGGRIFIGSGPGCPHALIQSLLDRMRSKHFFDLEFVHILTLGETPWLEARYQDSLRVNALFLGEETRKAVQNGQADYTPCFLSEIPSLFASGTLPIDVALVQVSPPDEEGYCSLGVTVDIVRSAVESARYVIAQINDAMPRTTGNTRVHMDDIHAHIEVSTPLAELPIAKSTGKTEKIGKYVSMLIEDGATLQMGIGKIPDAVLKALVHHKDLGVHTEMFSDGLMELVRTGVVNNTRKAVHPGKTVTSFCMGSKELYDFVHENPLVEFYASDYINDPSIISQNDNMVAINSALEVDLTGQVVSDSIGNRFYSGIGGQVDFIRGAAKSKGGRPIIALPSVTKKGKSRIVPYITQGSGVVTSRGDVHYVVTEYGIATLRGRSIRERALELIQVAHPDHREALLQKVRKSFWVPSYQSSLPAPVKGLGAVQVRKFKVRGGGKYFLRPLQASDERRIQDFFYSHDRDTLLLRYHYVPTRLSREGAYTLANVDQNEHLALCVASRQGPRETLHAVGSYHLIPKSKSAEIALVVQEEKRGLGLGKRLLKKIIRVARKRGLEQLMAVVQTGNQPMRHILGNIGFLESPGEDHTTLTLTLALKDPKPTTKPKETAPKTAAPKTTAPKATATKATASKAAASKENAPKAATSKAAAPKENAPKAAASKAAAPKENAPKAATSKENAPKAATPKENAPKAATSKENAPKAATPKATASKAAASKATAPKATAPKAATPKATTSKAAAPKATTPKETAKKATSSKK